jgi:hypothetical protein
MIPKNSTSNQDLPFINYGADTENVTKEKNLKNHQIILILVYEEFETNNNRIGVDFNNQQQQMKMEIQWCFWNFWRRRLLFSCTLFELFFTIHGFWQEVEILHCVEI